MAKEQVQPGLEEEYRMQVDNMINIELENIKALHGSGKKKGKKKKKNKKKKKKKKKSLKLPGFK